VLCGAATRCTGFFFAGDALLPPAAGFFGLVPDFFRAADGFGSCGATMALAGAGDGEPAEPATGEAAAAATTCARFLFMRAKAPAAGVPAWTGGATGIAAVDRETCAAPGGMSEESMASIGGGGGLEGSPGSEIDGGGWVGAVEAGAETSVLPKSERGYRARSVSLRTP
jgi:hypothetical protein